MIVTRFHLHPHLYLSSFPYRSNFQAAPEEAPLIKSAENFRLTAMQIRASVLFILKQGR
jgi:hypothetical protein